MLRFLFLVTSFFCAGLTRAQQPIELQDRRELFVDKFILSEIRNLQHLIGTPVSMGKTVLFNKPWEGQFSGGYVSVTFDGSIYKLYYRGIDTARDIKRQVTCYAESKDGVNWIKPNLGLFEVNGTLTNNVVLPGDDRQSSHNFSVMYDNNPQAPASEKYKAVGGVASSAKRKLRGLYRYVSADGIHWTLKDTVALFPDGYGMDSQNVLAWLPSENQYAIYLRTWTEDKPGDQKLLKGVRTIARSVSNDFTYWSEPERMNFGNTPIEDLYTNATQPYYRAPHLLVAMPFRFAPETRVLSDEEMLSNKIAKSMWNGVSDAVFMTSRGGYSYDRTFMESFVRPGLDQANWAARSTIPSLGVFPISKNEMSFFLTRNYGTPNCHLEQMKMRVDGFASLHAGYNEGYAITKSLRLKGKTMKINFSTSSIGYLKVVLIDERGKEIAGFSEKDAVEMRGDKIDGAVSWKSGKSLTELSDKTVRIKFIVRDADLYSFEIR